MSLDLTPLRNAIARLEEGLARYRRDTADTQIRDGLIQRFEFTYEFAHKFLRRYLADNSANPAAFAEMTFPDLIRSGSDAGLLIKGWPAWRLYRDMRSKTSHTYDEAVAVEVVAAIPDFLEEAEYLLARLEERRG
jgi:nucleotidyltransferase substrate binding protein (TIGR01987 family)